MMRQAFPKVTMSEMEQTILELSAEDDYGVWELWWAIGGTSNHSPGMAELKSRFARTICDLVGQHKVVAKRRDALTGRTGQAKPAEFSEHLLLAELNEIDQPRPEEMYWFGTP